CLNPSGRMIRSQHSHRAGTGRLSTENHAEAEDGSFGLPVVSTRFPSSFPGGDGSNTFTKHDRTGRRAKGGPVLRMSVQLSKWRLVRAGRRLACASVSWLSDLPNRSRA